MTGTKLVAVELLPSWPLPFDPKHLTLPATIAGLAIAFEIFGLLLRLSLH